MSSFFERELLGNEFPIVTLAGLKFEFAAKGKTQLGDEAVVLLVKFAVDDHPVFLFLISPRSNELYYLVLAGC